MRERLARKWPTTGRVLWKLCGAINAAASSSSSSSAPSTWIRNFATIEREKRACARREHFARNCSRPSNRKWFPQNSADVTATAAGECNNNNNNNCLRWQLHNDRREANIENSPPPSLIFARAAASCAQSAARRLGCDASDFIIIIIVGLPARGGCCRCCRRAASAAHRLLHLVVPLLQLRARTACSSNSEGYLRAAGFASSEGSERRLLPESARQSTRAR